MKKTFLQYCFSACALLQHMLKTPSITDQFGIMYDVLAGLIHSVIWRQGIWRKHCQPAPGTQ